MQTSHKMTAPNAWILIPARSGSKGIPRKNLRELRGRPLIQHVVETSLRVVPASRVLVSTDSDEIADAAREVGGVRVMGRDAELSSDTATLDEVALDVACTLVEQGASPSDVIITVQPTSPFVQASSIQGAIRQLGSCESKSVISVKREAKLRWSQAENGTAVPLYAQRLNRQQLPAEYTETGGIIGTTLGELINHNTRVVDPVGLVCLSAREAVDIDEPNDWLVAERYAEQQRIVIRADASKCLGMGHVYRALALDDALMGHDVLIVSREDGDFHLGADFLSSRAKRLLTVNSEAAFVAALADWRPDITFLDVLDTAADFVQSVRSVSGFTVCMEDLGAGAEVADLVVNDLYTDALPAENHWYGLECAILSPSIDASRDCPPFSEIVGRILVTFGGSDPGNLTDKTLGALQLAGYSGETLVVVGPGYAHGVPKLGDFGLQGEVVAHAADMLPLIRKSDLAITSAGRTVTEIMTQGVPIVTLCQNVHELRHTHASAPYGVMNLGLGEHVTEQSLAAHIQTLLREDGLRRAMRTRMLKAVSGRSNRAVVERILSAALEKGLGDQA